MLDPNPALMVNLGPDATPDPTRLTSGEPASLAVVDGTLYVLAYSFRAFRADFPGEIEGITILVALGPSF